MLTQSILVLLIIGVLLRSFLIRQESVRQLTHMGKINSVKSKELTIRIDELKQLREADKYKSLEILKLKKKELSYLRLIPPYNLLNKFKVQLDSMTELIDNKLVDDIGSIKQNIGSQLITDNVYLHRYLLERIQTDFISRLKSQHSVLSSNEINLCVYVKVGETIEGIAHYYDVATELINEQLMRTKKKLKLKSENDLREYLLNI